MSKFELVTLEELESAEEEWLTIPDFQNQYESDFSKLDNVDTFYGKHHPEGESRYRNCKRDLDSSLESATKYTDGWNEEDSINDAISAFNGIGSEIEDAQNSADDLADYRDQYQEACENYHTYVTAMEEAADQDIRTLTEAVNERDKLIKYLKEQLNYCLQVSCKSLELKQASEDLLDLDKE